MEMDDKLRHLLTAAKENYARRDFAQARPDLEQIAELQQGFADVYNMLGVVYHDGGLFSKAQQALERAIELNPRYTEAALNLAILYNDLGKYAEARETYGRALEHCKSERDAFDPYVSGKIANMHAELADAYRGAGKIDAAIDEFHKALGLRPTFGDLRTRLALTLMENRQYTVAAQELQRALLDLPDYLPARVQLGICCYSMGRQDEAVRHWTQVLEQDPHNSSAGMYLRMVYADKQRAADVQPNA